MEAVLSRVGGPLTGTRRAVALWSMRLSACFLGMALAEAVRADYGCGGIALILAFYFFRGKPAGAVCRRTALPGALDRPHRDLRAAGPDPHPALQRETGAAVTGTRDAVRLLPVLSRPYRRAIADAVCFLTKHPGSCLETGMFHMEAAPVRFWPGFGYSSFSRNLNQFVHSARILSQWPG